MFFFTSCELLQLQRVKSDLCFLPSVCVFDSFLKTRPPLDGHLGSDYVILAGEQGKEHEGVGVH